MEVEKDPERAKRDVQRYFPESSARSRPRQDRDAETAIGSGASTGGLSTAHTEPTIVFGDPVELQELALAEPALPLPADGQKGAAGADAQGDVARVLDGPVAVHDCRGQLDRPGGHVAGVVGARLRLLLPLGEQPEHLEQAVEDGGQHSPCTRQLVQNAYRALIAVSIGSLVGGYLFIVMSEVRGGRFLVLRLFGVDCRVHRWLGVCYMTLLNTRYFAAVIVLYSLCSLFFNLGDCSTPGCN